MASLTRSFAALRVRAPRALAHRSYADGPTVKTVEVDATAGPSSPEASSSSSSSASMSDAAGTAPSSTPVIPESADPTAATPPAPSALPAKHPRGMTPWGATKSYEQSRAEVKAEDALPLSQQILPMHPVPLPPWHTGPQSVYTINYPRPVFPNTAVDDYPNTIGGDSAKKRMRALSAISGLSQNELRDLRRCTVEMKYVVNMTTKGKMRSLLAYVLVGDPKKGMLGLGRGRGTVGPKAIEAAFYDAVLNMDTVDRYEGRTLWGQGKELETKFASTKVSLRARPPGHGLQVPVSVHRVLSACGIRDASASIYGSTHKINVVKAVIQLLHGGANPPGFGDGAGGQAKRDNKGSAMRSQDEIQRSRGRYGVDVGLTG